MMNGKFAVLALIMLLLTAQAHAEQVKLTDVKELEFKTDNNIETVYKNGELFAGAVKLPDKQGRNIIYVYKEGHRNGVATAYYENGRPAIEISYVHGQKNGDEVLYYLNGNPQRKSSYKNNVLHGEEILYYENGQPQKRAYYREGKLNDNVMEFDVNGNKVRVTPYIDDVKNGIEQILENNVMHTVAYKNGVLDGEDVIYYENGKPQVVKSYKNGKLNGPVNYLDREGHPTKIENYVDDVKNGLEQVIVDNKTREEYHYVNGKLDGVAKFSDGKYLTEEIHYKAGKKNGMHKTYKTDGSHTEVNYADDLRSGEAKAFYANGQLANKAYYFNDKKNGIMEKYFDTGVLSSSESYKDDVKDGICRYFDRNGYLLTVSRYEKGTELAKIDVNTHPDLKSIYEAYKKGQISRFSNKKNLWYLILWLGLNTGKQDIVETLEKEMSMYTMEPDNMAAYKRFAPAKFEEYTQKLYFGLTPLSYAVDTGASDEILHKFVSLVNVPNASGTTALQEAVRLNDLDTVKYLLLQKADVTSKDSPNKDILLYALKNGAQNETIAELIKAGASVNVSDKQENTPLSMAIEQQNGDVFDLLAQNGADLSILTGNGQTMLFYAYEHKLPFDIIDRLIKTGIDVNQKDNLGNVMLVKALSAGDSEMVKLLLQHGADVNAINGKKESAVSYALSNRLDSETENLLFSQKLNLKENVAKFNKPMWRILVENERLDLLKFIWDKNPEVIFEKDGNDEIPFYEALKFKDNKTLRELVLSYVDKADDTMIWTALETADLDLLKFMVAHKANVNAVNENGDTLLIYATKNTMGTDFFKVLETPDLDINKMNKAGEDALGIATFANNVKIVKNLLDHGADINRKFKGETYLMQLKNYQSEMTEEYLAHNPDLKIKADDGATLLMKAVVNLNGTLVKALAGYDIDFNFRDSEGNTALLYLIKSMDTYPNMSPEDIAASFRNIIVLLTAGGADINAQDFDGNTLLIKMAKMKSPAYTAVRDMLSEIGANMDMKDQYGKTAADYE
ncbi:MAG: ankyrin repeat domain-containing protein [Alphaproteobacteria bacterium]|nr:ankyrin repeat domain-containing protein [Alphaproteobacteria bacterium]